MFESAVVEIGDRLAGIVDGLDPDAVPGPAAAELWAALARVEWLAAAGKTLLARRLTQVHRPDRDGARSAAEALARRAGTTVGAARDALDTSTRLPELPLVDAAVRSGKLSPAQAAAVSDAAAANPATEQRLLELARTASLPELREECARVRAAADPDPAARPHPARRPPRRPDPRFLALLRVDSRWPGPAPAAPSPAAPAPGSNTTTAKTGPAPGAPAWTNSTHSANTTTTSRSATTGPSSPATATRHSPTPRPPPPSASAEAPTRLNRVDGRTRQREGTLPRARRPNQARRGRGVA
jgi:hypothetical protein